MNFDPQNPQQDPGMERRLLLVFVLTFVVLLISQPLLMKYAKQPAPAEKPQPAATQPAPAPAPIAPPAGAKVKPPRPPSPPPPPNKPPRNRKRWWRTISTASPSPTAARR